MAFFGRVGNLLRQAANKQLSAELRSAPSIFQAIRCMSSAASSRVFVGGGFIIYFFTCYHDLVLMFS